MSSSIIRASLPESRRARHEMIGNMAEQEVAKRLAEVFGTRNVRRDGPGYSGTDGEPDLLLKTDKAQIYIEVKSFKPFTRNYVKVKGRKKKKRIYRPSSVKFNRHARDDKVSSTSLGEGWIAAREVKGGICPIVGQTQSLGGRLALCYCKDEIGVVIVGREGVVGLGPNAGSDEDGVRAARLSGRLKVDLTELVAVHHCRFSSRQQQLPRSYGPATQL